MVVERGVETLTWNHMNTSSLAQQVFPARRVLLPQVSRSMMSVCTRHYISLMHVKYVQPVIWPEYALIQEGPAGENVGDSATCLGPTHMYTYSATCLSSPTVSHPV